MWAALFLDLWRRRNNEIAFRWGVDGVEDEELMRVQAARVRACAERSPWVFGAAIPLFLGSLVACAGYCTPHKQLFRRTLRFARLSIAPQKIVFQFPHG